MGRSSVMYRFEVCARVVVCSSVMVVRRGEAMVPGTLLMCGEEEFCPVTVSDPLGAGIWVYFSSMARACSSAFFEVPNQISLPLPETEIEW